jgi:hypothetical protein
VTFSPIDIVWTPRFQPLPPVGAFASGLVARELAESLIEMDETVLGRWSGVCTPDSLILLGEAATLPWVNGITYLGHDPLASRLLLPTNREPHVSVDLLERALLKASALLPPLAVIARERRIVSVAAARRVSADAVAEWLRLTA